MMPVALVNRVAHEKLRDCNELTRLLEYPITFVASYISSTHLLPILGLASLSTTPAFWLALATTVTAYVINTFGGSMFQALQQSKILAK
jgi:hypothetical protein